MVEELKVTLVQSDIHWESIDANLAMFEEKIRSIEEKTDLIVLPEMFSTGFSMNPQKLAEPMNLTTFRWMKLMAEHTEAVITGSFIVKEDGHFYNRMLAIYPDGSYKKYDKKHLFGLAGEDKEYTPGGDRITFEVNGWRVFPQICYDLRFPVFSRSRVSEHTLYEYDVLIYVASWPSPRIHAWDTLLQARAIENISYSIGVNRIGTDGSKVDYIGHSAVYDYLGQPVSNLGESEAVETVRLNRSGLEKFRNRFPFQADADHFTLP